MNRSIFSFYRTVSVASITAGLKRMVDDLREHAVFQRQEAATHLGIIHEHTAFHYGALSEADKAEGIAKNIEGLISTNG